MSEKTNELTEILNLQNQEIEIQVNLPNGNIENMYYDFKRLNYKQIESTKLCLLIWDQKFRDLPSTLPTMQQSLFEEAGARGMAMILYTKDKDGKPQPFTGDISKHRPYELLNYTDGEQYETLDLCKNFFLGRWGVIPHSFKQEFLNTADLLLGSHMGKMQDLMEEQFKRKGYSKKKQEEMTTVMRSILKQSLPNILQQDSSE